MKIESGGEESIEMVASEIMKMKIMAKAKWR